MPSSRMAISCFGWEAKTRLESQEPNHGPGSPQHVSRTPSADLSSLGTRCMKVFGKRKRYPSIARLSILWLTFHFRIHVATLEARDCFVYIVMNSRYPSH